MVPGVGVGGTVVPGPPLQVYEISYPDLVAPGSDMNFTVAWFPVDVYVGGMFVSPQ